MISNDDFIEFTIERTEAEEEVKVEKLMDNIQITEKKEKKEEKKVTNEKTLKEETLADKILREVAQRKIKKADDGENKKKTNLIDNFISQSDNLPSIKAQNTGNEDKAERSFVVGNELITEKLADLYVNQKFYDKALDAYDKLILKYPEKNTYFAAQIEKIKMLKNEL